MTKPSINNDKQKKRRPDREFTSQGRLELRHTCQATVKEELEANSHKWKRMQAHGLNPPSMAGTILLVSVSRRGTLVFCFVPKQTLTLCQLEHSCVSLPKLTTLVTLRQAYLTSAASGPQLC